MPENKLVINLISGPRNVSTALMYSFAGHPDFDVIDEPLYAHYLRLTGHHHPGYREILSHYENDGNKVIDGLINKSRNTHLFIKNMAHHQIGIGLHYLLQLTNVFLIRDPRDMLPTLIKQIPHPTLEDSAYKKQWELFTFLSDHGKKPYIIDARTFLADPKKGLEKVAAYGGFNFHEGMLEWSKGPKPYDGIWAKYWYHMLHESNGFRPYEEKRDHFPAFLVPLLHECDEYYHKLIEEIQ